MVKLSLCMITKNEEQLLENCLNSVKDIVDEIVIVDTGSTDNTISIAKRFTDKIFKIDWPDDFSIARNESLKHVTGDWILVLDGDEVISKEDGLKIKVLIKDENVDGYLLLQRTYTNDNDDCVVQKKTVYSKGFSGYIQGTLLRLFRNKQGIVFNKCIHENVMDSIDPNRLMDSSVIIHHYQYLKSKNSLFLKQKLYKQLNEKMPKTPINLTTLGFKVMMYDKDFKLAEKYFLEAIGLDRYYSQAYIQLSRVYIACNQPKKAVSVLRDLIAIEPVSIEAHTFLSKAFDMLGDKKSANLHNGFVKKLEMLKSDYKKTILEIKHSMKLDKTRFFCSELMSDS